MYILLLLHIPLLTLVMCIHIYIYIVAEIVDELASASACLHCSSKVTVGLWTLAVEILVGLDLEIIDT